MKMITYGKPKKKKPCPSTQKKEHISHTSVKIEDATKTIFNKEAQILTGWKIKLNIQQGGAYKGSKSSNTVNGELGQKKGNT